MKKHCEARPAIVPTAGSTELPSQPFELVSDFTPQGDQPEAIAKLTKGLQRGDRAQTLLGVTGSGKTYTMANLIQNVQRPTLVISPNKTLAAQLYNEFRTFFSKQRRSLLRQRLRILSTRGVYSIYRHVH